MVTSRVAFISKQAKNPNAGKLFLDYISVEARPGDHRQQGRSLFAALRRRRRGDDQGRHAADRRQGAPGADRPDAAGESRPGQAARLPVEVAAGEEGAVSISRCPVWARPDQGRPCPLSCTACSCSASPRLPCWRRCRSSSTRASSPRRSSTLRRSLSLLAYSFVLRRSGFLAGVLDHARDRRRHGCDRGAARRPARLPDGAHRRAGPAVSRAADPDPDLRLGGGDRVRLRGGDRPGRHFLDAGQGRARLRAVEPLFAARR